MFLFGVINCSPDSLHQESIVRNADEALARIEFLQRAGGDGLDVGGQGSTEVATLVDTETEWARMRDVLALAVQRTELVSVDTWRHEVMRWAMELGVNVLNAADGMSTTESWEIAAEFEATVVLPFMNGPNPHELSHVSGDPLDTMLEYFEDRLRLADRYGLRDRCLLDPGTGFGPHGWEWSDRYLYQRQVYSNLDRLQVFGLPLYIPLPWKETEQHQELLEIVVSKQPEYGRAHDPARVRRAEAAALTGAPSPPEDAR